MIQNPQKWKLNLLRDTSGDWVPTAGDSYDGIVSDGSGYVCFFLGTTIPRNCIASVTFLDTDEGALSHPAWNVGAKKNRPVSLWEEPDKDDENLCHVYIGAVGGINGVIACNSLFRDCINLREVNFNSCFHTACTEDVLYINKFGKTSPMNVNRSEVDMSSMFKNCRLLESIDFSGWDTSCVTNTYFMFEGCSSLRSLDLSGWHTCDSRRMFYGCSSLCSLNLSGWDTSNLSSTALMFKGCSSLRSLDLSSWDTSNITDMSCLFEGCTALCSLVLSQWNTSNVCSMSYLFMDCGSLRELDLSDWDTSNVSSMDYMFCNCTSLRALNLAGWDNSHTHDMRYMFMNCSSLTTLDISHFSRPATLDTTDMFTGCTNLKNDPWSAADQFEQYMPKKTCEIFDPPHTTPDLPASDCSPAPNDFSTPSWMIDFSNVYKV